MATELRLRRGTTDEHGNFIGAEAEATVDTDKNTIVVHDGQTQGGFPLAQESDTAPAVDSVATLRASSFPANLDRLWLSGYYGVGTAGGGSLYRDSDDTTTADNGGTVFVDDNGVRWKRNTAEIKVTDFGAKGDFDKSTYSGTDDAAAFQAAIDYIDSLGVLRKLIVPAGGGYFIGTSLNLTNGNVDLVGEHDGRDFGSTLIGNTGEDWLLDYSGTNRWFSIENISVFSYNSQSNQSKNILLLARESSTSLMGEASFNKLRIWVESDLTANNGFGTVAVASIGSESNEWISAYFIADSTFLGLSKPEMVETDESGNKTVIKNITSLYKTIDTNPSSNTENYFNGVILVWDCSKPALRLDNAAAWTFDSTFISGVTPAADSPTSPNYAIELANCGSITFNGDIERYSTKLRCLGFQQNHEISVYTSLPGTDYPVIKSDEAEPGARTTFQNCDINFKPTSSSIGNDCTFILSNNLVRLNGGRLTLPCKLNLTDNAGSRLRGTLVSNPSNYTITTNDGARDFNRSSYIEMQEDTLIAVSKKPMAKQGWGLKEEQDHAVISSLVDGTVNSRTTRTFSTGAEDNNVFVSLFVYGQGPAALPFYSKRVYGFRRSGSSNPYGVNQEGEVEVVDSNNTLSTLTITPNVESATGDPLSFSITFTLNSGSSNIGSIGVKVITDYEL